jgi:hypothetical protein
MTRTTMMDKNAGEYFQEPVEQKHLLEASTTVSLGTHVGNRLTLLQLAPISGILLVLTPYTSVGPTNC